MNLAVKHFVIFLFVFGCALTSEPEIIDEEDDITMNEEETDEESGSDDTDESDDENDDDNNDDDGVARDTVGLLFVGNSLTYSNDLPSLVVTAAKERGLNVHTKMIAYGNYGLEDHWNDGDVQEEIRTGNYKYVIIQQGPSSQEYGRVSLIEYGQKLKEVCDASGAELAYYMVWPSRTYYHTFEGVINNYSEAASINKALLCPVGMEWRTYFNRTADYTYYGPDGFHPSLKGSKVAAKVIVRSLF